MQYNLKQHTYMQCVGFLVVLHMQFVFICLVRLFVVAHSVAFGHLHDIPFFGTSDLVQACILLLLIKAPTELCTLMLTRCARKIR
jgi:hypothetical protein